MIYGKPATLESGAGWAIDGVQEEAPVKGSDSVKSRIKPWNRKQFACVNQSGYRSIAFRLVVVKLLTIACEGNRTVPKLAGCIGYDGGSKAPG